MDACGLHIKPVCVHPGCISGSRTHQARVIIAGQHETPLSTKLGLIAVAASFSNMVGGFIITDRMLGMFKTGKGKKA